MRGIIEAAPSSSDPNMLGAGDYRRFDRVLIQVHAEIVVEGHHYLCETCDIGLGGCLIATLERAPDQRLVNREGTIWLDFEDTIIEIDMVVLRVVDNTIGVGFQSSDLDKLMKLKRVLSRYI